MPNEHLIRRLEGIWAQLNAAHQAGAGMSASSKGREREAFVDLFLKSVYPPIYRFGSGDITDMTGHKTGQLDVVIEFPFGPSLPSVGSDQVRLYLAETVAAVIEVKSDLAGQWSEVRRTASHLSPINRTFGATMSMGEPPAAHVPLIAVGFRGWSTIDTLQKHIEETPGVEAALIIDSGLFVSSSRTGSWRAGGVGALWAMLCFTHRQISGLQSASTEPIRYLL
jgi:hypothetical protein